MPYVPVPGRSRFRCQAGDLVAVRAEHVSGKSYLIASFHGDTNGQAERGKRKMLYAPDKGLKNLQSSGSFLGAMVGERILGCLSLLVSRFPLGPPAIGANLDNFFFGGRVPLK